MSDNNLEFITLKKENIRDFAAERNLLLEKAKSKWVFFVDTDETVTEKLKSEAVNRVREANGFQGFYIYRKNYFLGKYIGTDKILRVGKKNVGKWIRRVHEVWEIPGKIGELKPPLIHESAKDLHEFIAKTNFYSTLHARENLENGKKSSLPRIIFYPAAKFIQSLFIGRGFVFSMLQSFHSFLSWSKEWQLQKG